MRERGPCREYEQHSEVKPRQPIIANQSADRKRARKSVVTITETLVEVRDWRDWLMRFTPPPLLPIFATWIVNYCK